MTKILTHPYKTTNIYSILIFFVKYQLDFFTYLLYFYNILIKYMIVNIIRIKCNSDNRIDETRTAPFIKNLKNNL